MALAFTLDAFALRSALAQSAPPVTLAPVEVRGQVEPDTPEPTRPSSRLRGDALRERAARTIGETIGDEPGVANASFGPGVGLPVIRGLSGPRVRMLTNGSATHDAGMFSPDHASTVEAVLADEVRVLRGPSTIRYGGGAIGGVVDVRDGRIPDRLPERRFSGAAQTRFGFNGNEFVQALSAKGRAGRIALHGDGFYRDRSNVSIPGCTIDEAAVRQQFGLINNRTSCGYIPNSDALSRGGSFGASAFGEIGYVGGSLSALDNNYGIPPSAGSHGGPDAPARIDLSNRRGDARMEWWIDRGVLETVRLDYGRVRYRHNEVESGVVATRFSNDADDWRVEAATRISEQLSGFIGLQRLDRVFSALGEEAFVPVTDTGSTAVYLMQRLSLGSVDLEAGWRTERQSVVAQPQRTVDGRVLVFPSTEFSAESYSLATTWRWQPNSSLRGILGRAVRAPEVHELYSFGAHLATRTFDVGNARLSTEAMKTFDVTLDHDFGFGRIEVTGFRNDASGFIYQRTASGIFWDTEEQRFRARCVRLEDCLPVTRYEQSEARFTGYEIDSTFPLNTQVLGRMELSVFADRVRGRLTALGEDVPRLPPGRYGVEVRKVLEDWRMRLRVTRAAAQDAPGANETPTAGYVAMGAYASRRIRMGDQQVVVFVNARNLLDRQIRNSTSFLRSFSPEPGRSIELGIEARF
jgi:iron complex outermembrane receptor protein